MNILIIGGGIAGATLAIALGKVGLKTTVLEQRSAATDTGGAFLTLAPNGVNALRAIDLDELPRQAEGFEQSGLDFYNAKGRPIAELPGESDVANYGARGMVMRRASLHQQLVREAQGIGVEFLLGNGLANLAEDERGVRARLEDGREIAADIVIGADGIWSNVRRLVWPKTSVPAYTGIIDCGGWANVDLPNTNRQQMHFGRKAFFGYTVHNGTAYWFSNIPQADAPARGEFDRTSSSIWLQRVRALNEGGNGSVDAILQAADSAIGAWPIYDLPALPTWHTDRICLIGDAAHAASPSTGQGASLAIEDAVVLAGHLARTTTPRDAFASFLHDRKQRVEKIVRMGRQIGERKVSSASASFFRDLMLPMFLRMGASATREQYSYRVAPLPRPII